MTYKRRLNFFIKSRVFLHFVSFILGAITVLGFAPFNYYLVVFFSLGMLLFIWINSGKSTAEINSAAVLNASLGYCFGLGFFGFSVFWIYISIHNFGNANAFLSSFITLIFILYLALFPALTGYILTRFFPKNNFRKFLLAFPALWVLVECFQGWFLTGFPWMNLGLSQIDSPLRGFAPIFGIYGVSFFTVFTAGLIVNIFLAKKLWQKILLIILIILLWTLSGFLTQIAWTKQSGKELTVSLIQANISQELKWEPLERENILQKYLELTKPNLNSNLIVWPEAAIPAFPRQVSDYLNKLQKLIKQNHTTIITGIPLSDSTNGKELYYNGMLSFGNNENKYLKRHLVPFGEFVPLQWLVGNFMSYFAIPMSDFTSGNGAQPDFVINDIVIAPFVCYEIAYPAQVLDYFPRAGLIITISDDSWFGKSIALAQHLAIARMRSLETGRFQLVVANTGFTAIINSAGKIQDLAPAFKDAVLNGNVQIRTGTTFWVLAGHYLWFWLVVLCLGIAVIG